MSRSRCVSKPVTKPRREVIRNVQKISPRVRPKSVSPELIERIRQLMERSIEFVPHPDFDSPRAEIAIQSSCPPAAKTSAGGASGKVGIVFVSGLVDAPLLSPEEEKCWFKEMNFLKFRAERNRRRLDLRRPDLSLVEQIESDLDAAVEVRNRIVQGNVRLIVALAKKLTNSLDLMGDLISEGMVPLIRSVELFDIGLGNRFSTYATWAIRNQMLRSLKRSRFSTEIEPGEDAPSLENLPDWRTLPTTDETTHDLRVTTVNRLLQSLSDRERQILTARFALNGQPAGQSLADIAEQTGLSKERVRQIAINSISKLRESMTYDEFEAMS